MKIDNHKKDFQKWHSEKSSIHHDKMRPFFHVREVWFCSLGANVGFEQDGSGDKYLRPVLILRKFNNEVLWVLPLTKHKKRGKYYFCVTIFSKMLPRTISTIILSQIRLVDAKRLQYKFGDISEDDFSEIKKRLRALLE